MRTKNDRKSAKDLMGAKPGYILLLTFTISLLGNQNPVFIRLLTILFASFLVFVGYSFGKKLGGNTVGMLTAVFLTFHHKIFDLSYWIMTDIPFTFLSFLALYLIFRNFEMLITLKNIKTGIKPIPTKGRHCFFCGFKKTQYCSVD